MATETNPSFCFLTKTYARDIDRFALLRRSLQIFAPDIEHVAYVDSEDLRLFQQRFGPAHRLTLSPTADILPPRLERLRRFWRKFQRPFHERLGWRLMLDTAIHGWKVQQIVKLEAAARVQQDAVVFLDSDDFLCGPVGSEETFVDGHLRLLERPAETFEDFLYDGNRQAMVGGSLLAPARAFSYIEVPPRFLKRTAQRMLDHLTGTYTADHWHTAFMLQALPSEYNMLGWVARELEGYKGYRLVAGSAVDWAYQVKDLALLEQEIATCLAERGRRRYFRVQSNMKDSSYIPRARALIEELARQR